MAEAIGGAIDCLTAPAAQQHDIDRIVGWTVDRRAPAIDGLHQFHEGQPQGAVPRAALEQAAGERGLIPGIKRWRRFNRPCPFGEMAGEAGVQGNVTFSLSLNLVGGDRAWCGGP